MKERLRTAVGGSKGTKNRHNNTFRLERAQTGIAPTRERVRHRMYDLGERLNDLNCLYAALQLVGEPNTSLKEVFQGIVNLIPASSENPEMVCAEITFDGQQFRTGNFKKTAAKQSADLVVFGEKVGSLEVYWLGENPTLHERMLSGERERLIKSIAREVGIFAERKRGEESLPLLAAVVHDSNDAITVQDLEGNIAAWNRAAEAMYGWSEVEAVRMNIRDIIPEQRQEVEARLVRNAIGGNGVKSFETERITKDNRRLQVWVTVTELFDVKGGSVGITTTERDITKQKRVARELAIRDRIVDVFLSVPDSEMYGEMLQVVMEAMESEHGVFAYIGENGALVVPAAARHVGGRTKRLDQDLVLPSDRWDGTSWAEAIREKKIVFQNKPSANILDVQTPLERDIALPIICQGETIGLLQVANRKTDYCQEDIELLETVGYHIAPILSARLQRDRQENARRQGEEERLCLIAELEQKNKELREILYVASHDLRSPLVNMQGFNKELERSLVKLASLLENESVPAVVREKVAGFLHEEIPESVRYVQKSISKIDSLLSGLLRVSRLGRDSIKIERIDTNALISDVISASEYRIKETGARLGISHLPPCKGDIMQMNQVFSNLIDNALKYLAPDRPGVVTISGRRERGQAVYCVEDNGIGIAREHQEKVFEIFHQLNPEKSTGEGLGLTIVRRILERQHGKIWLESVPGKGSKFFVSLPCA
ncbi:MAG: ATP-binding protein [bacterium]